MPAHPCNAIDDTTESGAGGEVAPVPSADLRLMTADEAFNVAMNTYPSLYTAATLELAKLKFFDNVFNTIGNGTSTIEEFTEHYALTPEKVDLIHDFPEKYIGTTPLHYAYTEIVEEDGFHFPKYGSDLPGLYTQDELDVMPHVLHSVLSNRDEVKGQSRFVPYPNFQKRYSLVWNVDMGSIDPSWREAALSFYRFAKTFFESDDAHAYADAVPKDPSRRIADYEEAFARCRKPGMSEEAYREAISEAYELEYTGDTEDFIRRRWAIEKSRILDFLEETTGMLENVLASQPARTPNRTSRSRP